MNLQIDQVKSWRCESCGEHWLQELQARRCCNCGAYESTCYTYDHTDKLFNECREALAEATYMDDFDKVVEIQIVRIAPWTE